VNHILLDPGSRPVIAHRGASADRPENTLEAFRLALAQGADAFELDVRITRDGVPVLMHDPALDRTTDRTGLVRRLAAAEVRRADAGAGYLAPDGSRPWAGRGIGVPTLAEVLEEFPRVPILVEPKVPDRGSAIARVLLALRATERCVVASFERGALRGFRRGPFLVGADRPAVTWLWLSTRLGVGIRRPRGVFYAPPDRWRGRVEVPTVAFVAEARRHGIPVHVWTVDDPARARELWRRGVNGIITNRPGLMVAARGSRA
jgi:glycerophosphoryl diester phosphodiesterase